jgi:hypothetical protein
MTGPEIERNRNIGIPSEALQGLDKQVLDSHAAAVVVLFTPLS